MALYRGEVLVSGDGEGGSSAQLSAHDARLSVHDAFVQSKLTELENNVGLLKQTTGNPNCMDWGAALNFRFTTNAQCLSCDSVPYDMKLQYFVNLTSAGGTPGLSVDGMAVKISQEEYAGEYGVSIPCGTSFKFTSNNFTSEQLPCDIQVIPYRYGNKAVTPSQMSAATFEDVFSDGKLSEAFECVSAFSLSGLTSFSDQAVIWDAGTGGWDDYVCYYKKFEEYAYSVGSNVYVVLRAKADVVLSFTGGPANEDYIFGIANAGTRYCYYAVAGSVPSTPAAAADMANT